ncbi:FadR/GntR family transcriptional regulator [Desulfurispira natronophila]|uniref:Pyruvate dehydrogenase complex repressor n=1 Tax=Desulfurispira natronophila TaxID=682562 RepID=A0A7W7Y617_9BACT|nr:FadR/GntR family transcriptional regulator [Desulfurispira natronophila]MBB5022714.1 GntR family transcriptional repressor for pyruvate dehydrogenase complex [Desulfurispira natronophila]
MNQPDDMFAKIKPKRISDEIYSQIKELILAGKLQPGQKLPPERELAANMGVSRPSLREAIHRLEAQGFVSHIQGSGTYVSSMTENAMGAAIDEYFKRGESIFDVVEMRKVLETWAARIAAERATDEEIVQMEEYLEEMRVACEQMQVGHEPDANFHSTISYATHNVLFVHVMNTIHQWVEQVSYEVRSRMFQDPEHHTMLYRQHKAIFEAIRDRNVDGAGMAMLEHMKYIEEQTRQIFADKLSRSASS